MDNSLQHLASLMFSDLPQGVELFLSMRHELNLSEVLELSDGLAKELAIEEGPEDSECLLAMAKLLLQTLLLLDDYGIQSLRDMCVRPPGLQRYVQWAVIYGSWVRKTARFPRMSFVSFCSGPHNEAALEDLREKGLSHSLGHGKYILNPPPLTHWYE